MNNSEIEELYNRGIRKLRTLIEIDNVPMEDALSQMRTGFGLGLVQTVEIEKMARERYLK